MAKVGTKPNGIHYLDVVVEKDGEMKRQRVSCDTRDKAEAERQKRQWIAGVHPKHPAMGGAVAPKGRVVANDSSSDVPVRKGVTMAQLLDRCLSDPDVWGKAKAQKTVISNVKLLSQRLGTKLVVEMDTRFLKSVMADMREEGYADGTIKRHINAITRALREAVENYDGPDGKPMLANMPTVPRLKRGGTRTRFLSSGEETLVFASMDRLMVKEPARQWQKFRWMIRLMIDTGFRLSETQSLGPHSVRMIVVDDKEVPFLEIAPEIAKSGVGRIVPCTAAVIEMLPLLNALAVGGVWFPFKNVWDLWSSVRQDVKAHGHDIDDVVLHSLRHTCATNLLENGVDIERAALWLGHSDSKITSSTYVHLQGRALGGAVAALNARAAA